MSLQWLLFLLRVVKTLCVCDPAFNRLLWFLTIGEPAATFDEYERFTMVAIASAQFHAPCLQPVVLYDVDNSALLPKVHRLQRTLEHTDVLFYQVRSVAREWQNKTRFYAETLRYNIPLVFANILSLLGDPDVDGNYALYSDCDVMFLHDPVPLLHRREPPRVFAMGPEGGVERRNNGVMWINVNGLAEWLPQYIGFAIRTRQPGHSQSSWLEFEARQGGNLTDNLPNELNWRLYWPKPATQPAIVHFHGPKPGRQLLECIWSLYIQRGKEAFNLVANNQTASCPITKQFSPYVEHLKAIGRTTGSQCFALQALERYYAYLHLMQPADHDVLDFMMRGSIFRSEAFQTHCTSWE